MARNRRRPEPPGFSAGHRRRPASASDARLSLPRIASDSHDRFHRLNWLACDPASSQPDDM
eukprot:3146324-Alexandrium_andersonii.AAC.1